MLPQGLVAVMRELNGAHYSDVIMGTMGSQITSLTIVYSTVYSGADKGKHQSTASLAIVRGIHWWLVNSHAQMASNAENVSIWWRHHACFTYGMWWRYQALATCSLAQLYKTMMTSYGNAFCTTCPLCGPLTPVDSPHKRFDYFVSQKKLVNKQSSCQLSGIPWYSCDIAVMCVWRLVVMSHFLPVLTYLV